ncbi:het domain-containing protein [Fusarium mexicanum]|uniref:Het domain-containing protein n=1 Tax=Fusarium mexicanum TaxID=751941 RepID=A0A8H5MKX2_9HYPO|nr:het domain-containing protein [Fusarium mexicanum]
MPLELHLESDRAIVSSDDNNWIQYIHNDFDDSDVDSIEEIFEKLGKFNILGLLNLAIRLRDISGSLKGRISSALTNLGLHKPRVSMDQEGRYARDVPNKFVGELNFFGLHGSPTSWDSVGVAAEISGDTSSDAAYEWFRNQLDHCFQNHRLCKESNVAKLPPRVLDLGPSGTAELDNDIKLVSSLGQQDRYVCLSYCWGGTIDIRLLRNRYKRYLRRIPWDILPQGYRDAIQLTRKLGVRYVWIDSLCIVQDNEDDWRQQASLMAQIFRNAYVTIAATKSRNPNDGYFSVSPSKFIATRMEYEAQNGEIRHAYVRQTIPHFFSSTVSPDSDFTKGNFPLLSRGWVFQERLLSPRILHLGDVEMAWECNESCACECIGETKIYESEPRWTHTKGGYTRRMAEAKSEKDVQPEWRSIVEHYTKTTLTYRKDVLAAISGVVRDMKRHRSDRYLAGVWEDSVLEDLAWISCDGTKARPNEWNAPSWSWASVTVPVKFPNRRTFLDGKYIQDMEFLEHRTRFVEARITPVGQDETAQLSAAHMVLVGPMISAKLDEDPDILSQRQLYLAINEARSLVFAPDYDLRREGPSCVPMGTTIYILHLCQEPKFNDKKRRDTTRQTFSLVLRRLHGVNGSDSQMVHSSKEPTDGTYERIGIVIQGPDLEYPEGYVAAHGVDCVVKLV